MQPLDDEDEERDGGDRLGYGDRDGRYERGYDEDDEDARLVGVRLAAAMVLHARRQLTMSLRLGLPSLSPGLET